MKSIHTAAELYAHAIAIEREAVARYSELAQRMDDLGNEPVAEVFAHLARAETEHLCTLERRTAGVPLPQLASHEYAWFGAEAPETPARELVFNLMTPRSALAMALDAEKRAEIFFEQVLLGADDPALRGLAREMAADEAEHVSLIERLLAGTPDRVDWNALYSAN
jgi:rubrerythrin